MFLRMLALGGIAFLAACTTPPMTPTAPAATVAELAPGGKLRAACGWATS